MSTPADTRAGAAPSRGVGRGRRFARGVVRFVVKAFLVVTAPTGPTLPDPIFALRKEGLVDRLELRAFDRAQSDQLVTRALGGHVDASALQRLWTLSLGNALFLRELVEGARESGGLRGTVWARASA